jgi:hypothetical protein
MDYQWSLSFSDIGDEEISHIETDNTGASFLVFKTNESITISTEEGEVIVDDMSALLKVSASGEILWAKPIDFTIIGMRCDLSNNDLILVGQYNGIVDLDPGSGIFMTTTSASFMSRLNSDGEAIWIKILNPTTDILNPAPEIIVENLVLDHENNIVIYLKSYGNWDADLNDGSELIEIPFSDGGALVVVRYTSEGAFLNEYHTVMEILSIQKTQLQINDAGEFLLSALIFGDIDFNQELNGGELLVNPFYLYNTFILQLNSDLVYDWHQHLYGTELTPISIQSYNSKWYVSFYFDGEMDVSFGPVETLITGEGDILYSIDQSGAEISHIQSDLNLETISLKVVENNLVIMGWLFGVIDLDPSEVSEIFSSAFGGADAIMIFLDENLNYLAHEEMIGLSFDQVEEMEYTNAGEIYVKGTYTSDTFQAQEGGTLHQEAPMSNSFLVKYDFTTFLSEKTKHPLEIFPNPATTELYIKNPFDKPIQCNIYSSTGSIQESFLLKTNTNTISVEHLSPGLYILTIPELQNSSGRFVIR